jgi:hypothetical protein
VFSRLACNVPSLVVIGFLSIASCYLLHLGAPLKVVDDGPYYLDSATDIASGLGYHNPHLPRGYPQALAALDSLGLHSSAAIIGLNLVCMAIGLFLIGSVVRRELGLSRLEAAVGALLCCFSWIWIYLARVPMSEMLFFTLSSATLASLSEAKRQSSMRAAIFLACATGLATAAIFVRMIGLALVPAVALTTVQICVQRHLVSKRAALTLLFAASLIGGSIAFVSWNHLVSSGYSRAWRDSAVDRRKIPYWRVAELGELFQNISSSAFKPTSTTLPIESVSANELLMREVNMMRYIVGVGVIMLTLWGAIHRQRLSHVEVFLAGYALILMFWPFNYVRFWAPVLPLLIALAWIGLKSLIARPVILRRVAVCYGTAFCLFGAVAMGYSLWDQNRAAKASREWMIAQPEFERGYEHFGGVLNFPH